MLRNPPAIPPSETERLPKLAADGKTLLPEVISRVKAHLNGVLHPSEHVFGYTDDGRILLQVRSKNKLQFPGKVDVSATGHTALPRRMSMKEYRSVLSEENGSDRFRRISAIRELKEEIGVDAQEGQLTFLGDFWHAPPPEDSEMGTITNVESVRTYGYRLPSSDPEDYVFPDGEVEKVFFASLEEIEREILTGEGKIDFYNRSLPYFAVSLAGIRKLLG